MSSKSGKNKRKSDFNSNDTSPKMDFSTSNSHNDHAEYSALRAEITSRLQIVSEMTASTATIMLTVMLIFVTLYVGTINPDIKLNQWLFVGCIAFNLFSVFTFYFISYSLSYKFGENLRQIAMISAYLAEF